jgi:2-dehydropantoate 2-reductase
MRSDGVNKRIAMLGAGAVGGYVGAGLAAAGRDVTLIDFWHEHVEAIRARGLEISGMEGDGTQVVHADTLHFHEISGLARRAPIDIAFVSVKSYDTEWVTTMIRPYLAPGGFVVSLQNCVNEECIVSVVGWGRTVGCVVSRISVALFEPGRIRRTAEKGKAGHTVFKFGEVHGRSTKRVEELAALLAPIDSAAVTTNLWGERWSKLSQNSMRGPLAAASGLNSKGVDRNDTLRPLALRIGCEAALIGQANGFRFDRIDSLDASLFLRAGTGDADAFAELDRLTIEKAQKDTRGEMQRPSMGQDMMKGRRTEIDFMNGFIIDKGRGVGLPAPTNSLVLDAVKRVERGEIAASPDNFSAESSKLAAEGLPR